MNSENKLLDKLKNTDIQTMKPKNISKIVIDLVMTVLLIAQMGLHFWADVAHEWIGAGMFILFIAHHLLNLNWYKTMFKGKYTSYRILRLVVDGTVFVAMIGLMVSGVILSQHVFAFLSISGAKDFARTLHLLASYWGFVLMALHLGLHWDLVIGMVRKRSKTSVTSPVHIVLAALAGIVIAGYGFYVFIDRELLSYMPLQNFFVYFDYEASRILFYLDNLAMMSCFVWIAQNIAKRMRKRPVNKKMASKEYLREDR